MKVTDPAGRTWRVQRRWLPWRRKVRDVPDVPVDTPFIGGDDIFSAIILVVTVIILIPVILMAALMLAELLLLLLLLPLWVLVRAVRGGAWPIEVSRGKTLMWTESVHGWSASRARVRAIGQEIKVGTRPSH